MTIYRYNASAEDIDEKQHNSLKNTGIYVAGLGVIYLIICNAQLIIPYTRAINFALLSYILLSISESISHRYFMHCNNNPIIKSIVEQIPYLADTCKSHMQHHVNVNPDMSVNDKHDDPTNDAKFRMGWNIFIPIAVAAFGILQLSKYITNYKLSLPATVGLAGVATFAWEYLWNKSHVEMHDFEYNYSIASGPYDEGIVPLGIVTKLLYNNHEIHHLQKGDDKGNYNVVMLGADEWMLSNNKTVDNTEYCKTHEKEEICLNQMNGS
jgi:hypothetical protein